MSQDGVLALIDKGVLPAVDGRHPKTNRPMNRVAVGSHRIFRGLRFAFRRSRSSGTSIYAFQREQTRRGIVPAFNTGVVLYRRVDLTAVTP
ncbi:hypothetical protein [Chenggangzhangella methanolivorans]|uniref:hypothetical protein n=1 Tax=Chenggangzhangella methanolivorans TaxID=1437009 RepID=UPI003D186970